MILFYSVLPFAGWNYTKLTDVSLQRVSPSGEILNNVQLVTSLGCLNPSMQGVCTQAPSYDPPLGYKLPFKAVMFQGMRSGEDVIMSMRITGCLEYNDCFINQEQCNNPNTSGIIRRKRDMKGNSTNDSSEISEISKISFKVVMPHEQDVLNDRMESQFSNSLVRQTKSLILFISLGFIALLMCLGICALIKFRKS